EPPQEKLAGPKEGGSNASSDGSKESKEHKQQDKELKVNRTQESIEKPPSVEPAGYDMKNVKKYVEGQNSPVKTDLRSVKDLKFEYNPKKPIGDVRSSTTPVQLAEEQRTQMIVVDRPEDRELTLLAPNPSKSPNPTKSPLPTISLYDPLCGGQKVNLEKPVENSPA
ncbi:hypothetical protein COOONC_23420, partial [Cooperia oncophora]